MTGQPSAEDPKLFTKHRQGGLLNSHFSFVWERAQEQELSKGVKFTKPLRPECPFTHLQESPGSPGPK